MVIDAWVVPNPPDIARLWPDHLAHVFKLFKREEALAGATPDELVAEMDEAGVDVAILTGVVEESFVIGNDVTARFVEAAPARFRGRRAVLAPLALGGGTKMAAQLERHHRGHVLPGGDDGDLFGCQLDERSAILVGQHVLPSLADRQRELRTKV